MPSLTVREYIEVAVKRDASLTATIEGGLLLGFTVEELMQAIREWIDDSGLS